ncbi:CBS domain-containing protein [Aureibacter tunicatorum]|uniref:CBS domain-containing protein n=1 Tax=Aureibacter tunicatorum TaxID=866807 RepID=A0AAE4BSG5_9BACT|nr:CBS domain-containing protein [Aureibacter tunicatorum]MDR6238377.1 CBS domain-containing protein [Aureibacter tunicatorum]BDD03409.1 hypothetical protein AUTU_08920 [Aureibacter tunicatorum]
MKKREPISKIVSSSLITISPSSSLEEVEATFLKNKIRHLPVVENGKLVGIISLTDLQRISFVNNFGDDEGAVDTVIYNLLTLDQVMIKKPVTVQQDQTIKEAAEILASHEFHALPVMDGEKVVGIVTTTDLIKYLIDLY